jgi:hypothetical protein
MEEESDFNFNKISIIGVLEGLLMKEQLISKKELKKLI